MGANGTPYYYSILLCFFFGLSGLCHSSTTGIKAEVTARILVNVSRASAKKIPETLFGVFFEEINHAGAGGLWAELVSNRGFEAGGSTTPSNINPWSVIGDELSIQVSTHPESLFPRNIMALRMVVLCDIVGMNICPSGGVGIYNPGFWGMISRGPSSVSSKEVKKEIKLSFYECPCPKVSSLSSFMKNIEQGKTYKLVLYIRSISPINLFASLTSLNGSQTLATVNIKSFAIPQWRRMEFALKSKGTDANSKLQLTTKRRGVIWFDQVSLMPTDTYKGHGFRNDLFKMVKELRPGFLRFPGGCFVEGDWLRNAFRWKETIGAWEERPGHFGDVWHYWTDDGLGHFEFLLLAEDLGTLPVWVFNNGISHHDEVNTSSISPFVQEILDGIEFARGDSHSKWGFVRARLGHPEPFDLRYVAVGNEDCGKENYKGNYLKFHSAIKSAYPDIKIISNCDASSQPLDHPADLYDYHTYSSSNDMFSKAYKFDQVMRKGPKAFVSEYAVTGKDAGNGSLLAAIAEAGFLIGLEKNCDAVEMSSYAPLFVNINDRTWMPDAIVFDSSRMYGTPSYWMQQLFKDSNGATLVSSTLLANDPSSLIASAITWNDLENSQSYLRIKVVNFGSNNVTFQISINGLEPNSIILSGSTKTELKSSNLMEENSFQEPKKVVPVSKPLENAGNNMNALLYPYSFTSFDLATNSDITYILGFENSVNKS